MKSKRQIELEWDLRHNEIQIKIEIALMNSVHEGDRFKAPENLEVLEDNNANICNELKQIEIMQNSTIPLESDFERMREV